MNCIIKSLADETIYEVCLDKQSTIRDLMQNIKENIKDKFFDILHNQTILNLYDSTTLDEFFESTKDIILTIVKIHVPYEFNSLDDLIDYINNFNSTNPICLNCLVNKYIELEDRNAELKIINIHFIITYDNKHKERYNTSNKKLPRHTDENIFDDKNIIMNNVKKYMKILYYASERLKDDRETVMFAVQSNGYALHDASTRLQDDREIVMIAIQTNTFALGRASIRLRDDKEIVMTAVQNSKWALKYASERLQDDKEIVMTAVQNAKLTLRYASKRLQDDKDIISLL